MRWTGGLRLGSIGGIDIVADPSLLIIFVLIWVTLAAGVFPAWHPRWSSGLCWITAAGASVLFFGSVLAHELSHALVGRARGIGIRRITLFIFGGVAQMESEPRSWRDELALAVVGPITSLALGVAFLVLAALTSGPLHVNPSDPRALVAALDPFATLLFWLGPINIVLGLFNLVPGFPLDGGRMLRAVMWGLSGDLHLATRWASLAGQAIAWLLMAAGVLMILGLEMPLIGGGLVNGLWLAFIGWYLNNAALTSYRQLLLRESLESLPVRELMLTRFVRVDPGMRVATLIEEHVMASGQRAFPVQSGGGLVGMVTLHDLQKCARDRWVNATAQEIMTPASQLTTVGPDEPVLEALALLADREVGQLPVVRDGELVGLLRREEILKWLSLHSAPGASRPGRTHDTPGS